MEMDETALGGMLRFLCIGGVIVMVIIFIFIAKKVKKSALKSINNLYLELAKRTGLQLSESNGTYALDGMYKGYQTHLFFTQEYVSRNARGARGSVSVLVASLHVDVMSALPFPQLGIYDPPSIINDIFGTEKPTWNKLNINGDLLRKGVHFYGNDEMAAQKAAQSQELKMLLSNWQYPDIRMEGNELKLVLDGKRISSSDGRMHNQASLIQALDIAVAAAKAVQN